MAAAPGNAHLQRPALLKQAKELQETLKALSVADLRKTMHLSADLAEATATLIAKWNTRPKQQTAALDAFRGDIYRGLVAETLTDEQRTYANETLRILSGLYGILRPFDGIVPYRLELMYSIA
ncbi:MAG: YaaA family protein, partial [Thermomicrobiales bacterium]